MPADDVNAGETFNNPHSEDLVGEGGLEPPFRVEPDPKSGASANFATRPGYAELSTPDACRQGCSAGVFTVMPGGARMY